MKRRRAGFKRNVCWSGHTWVFCPSDAVSDTTNRVLSVVRKRVSSIRAGDHVLVNFAGEFRRVQRVWRSQFSSDDAKEIVRFVNVLRVLYLLSSLRPLVSSGGVWCCCEKPRMLICRWSILKQIQRSVDYVASSSEMGWSLVVLVRSF